MSLRTPRNLRQALTAVGAAALLAGCAGNKALDLVIGQTPPAPPPAEAPSPVSSGKGAHTLVFSRMIKGKILGVQFKATNFLAPEFFSHPHSQLIRPTSVAARSHFVYIYDGADENLYRFDLKANRLKLIKDLHNYITHAGAEENLTRFSSFKGTRTATYPPPRSTFNQVSIYVMPNLNYFVADTYGGRVFYFDAHGRLLRTFGAKINLVHPVGVVVDEDNSRVLVGDGRNDFILKFDFLGKLEGSMGARGNAPGEFINMMAITADKDDLYVAGRLGHRLQILSHQGKYKRDLAGGAVRFPTAIAVDGNKRVYVSSYLDNTIRVFSSSGKLIDTVGGTGVTPGHFKRITGLWADQGYLYVADSLNGRVQIFRIVD